MPDTSVVVVKKPPPVTERDWYLAKEAASVLSGAGNLVSESSVRRAADRLGVVRIPSSRSRQEYRFPKSVIDPLRGLGLPQLSAGLSLTAAPANIDTDRKTMVDEGLLAHLQSQLADTHDEVRRLRDELTGARVALQRADDRNGQLQGELSKLRDDYADLLSIARRAGVDQEVTMDRVIGRQRGPGD